MKTIIVINKLIDRYRAMWRWAIVGITTAVIDYILFVFLYSIVSSVVVANLLSGLVALSFNYTLHYFWSFKSQRDHKQSGFRYLINLVVIWSFGTLLLKFLISSGIEPHIAKVIPIFITAPGSFLSMHYFVFKKR